MILIEQWDKLLELVKDGVSITDGVIAAGMNRRSVYSRLKRDKKFREQWHKALVSAKSRAVQTIQKAMGEHWQAAAWWLERVHPEEFGEKLRNAAITNNQMNVTVTVADEISQKIPRALLQSFIHLPVKSMGQGEPNGAAIPAHSSSVDSGDLGVVEP